MLRLSLNLFRIVFGKRKYWKPIHFRQYQYTKLIRAISYSLNSIWNDFVLHNSPRKNNSRYALSITKKLFKTQHNLVQNMENLAIFKPPELHKKNSEVKYLFTFEDRESISSMGYKKFSLKTIISIGENWLNKETTSSINITFSSKVGTTIFFATQM